MEGTFPSSSVLHFFVPRVIFVFWDAVFIIVTKSLYVGDLASRSSLGRRVIFYRSFSGKRDSRCGRNLRNFWHRESIVVHRWSIEKHRIEQACMRKRQYPFSPNSRTAFSPPLRRTTFRNSHNFSHDDCSSFARSCTLKNKRSEHFSISDCRLSVDP